MKAYVGADWSATRVVCATAAESGRPRNIAGAIPSLASVRELIVRVRERHGATEIHVIIESGSAGWVRLFAEAGAITHVVDAKQAKKFAESLSSSGSKSDKSDARTLVEMLRSSAHCPPIWEANPELESLKALSAAREQASKERTRVIQQLRSVLCEHMPLVDQHLTIGTQWATRFLRRVPTPAHAADLDFEEFVRLTKRCGTPRRESLWRALQDTESPWLSPALSAVEAMRVESLLDRLELVDRQLEGLDAELDRSSAVMEGRALLESVDGVGLQTAVLLLVFAFGGSMPTHRDQAAVQLGAAPVFRGSGTHKNGQPKGHAVMRRAASSRARRGSYLLGRLAQQNLGWAKAMYADGRARGQSAATAYRRISRSLLRILTAMIRDGEPYDDAKYVAALKARGVVWAASL